MQDKIENLKEDDSKRIRFGYFLGLNAVGAKMEYKPTYVSTPFRISVKPKPSFDVGLLACNKRLWKTTSCCHRHSSQRRINLVRAFVIKQKRYPFKGVVFIGMMKPQTDILNYTKRMRVHFNFHLIMGGVEQFNMLVDEFNIHS